jgi:hypothetical protein
MYSISTADRFRDGRLKRTPCLWIATD